MQHKGTLLLLAALCLVGFALGHGDTLDRSKFPGKSNAEIYREILNMPRGMRTPARGKGCQGCLFAFQSPIIPSFTLPPPQPNSPGDVTLNVGNPIAYANGNALLHGCNGHKAEYLDDGLWTDEYVGANGKAQSLKDQFYATGAALKIRTIQSHSANLAAVLDGKQVRLHLTCDHGKKSCLNFYVNAQPKVDTCDACAGLINRTAEDLRLIALQQYHAAMELEANDLPATLETFADNGAVFFWSSGMGGSPPYGGAGTIEHFYGNYVMFGRFFGTQEDELYTLVMLEVSDDHLFMEVNIKFNHTGPFYAFLPNVAPTHRRVSFNVIFVFHFDEHGKILTERGLWDQASLLKQLGLITDETLPIVDGAFWDKIFAPLSGPPFNEYAPPPQP